MALFAPSAVQAQEVVEYYATDAIGSIRVVFNASGQVLGRQDYTPYGTELLPAPQFPAERFGGQPRDGETDLAYFNARMFQSRTGRFTSVDPVYAGLFDPQQWNRYGYARNNPERFVDPDGLWICRFSEGRDPSFSKPFPPDLSSRLSARHTSSGCPK